MYGNAQCIVCYRTLCRNSFFFLQKDITRLAMYFFFFDNIKGNDRTLKILQLKAVFIF